ncbi:MAG: GMC family oxidoreductase [Planctomycetes bacterium]|nr:GMC family oxidoreductase [Planctomycetota bacterium]
MQIALDDLSRMSESDDAPPVVIVGSGAVGLFLGVLLARVGVRALVLEAGGRTLGGFANTTFECVGRRHQGIQISRSRSLGGTTNLWGGQLVELMPADLQRREWPCGEAWPIRYEELASHFRETYQALGVPDDIIEDPAVWEWLGTPRPQLGQGLEVFLTRWMRMPNLAVLFSREIETDSNLLVATDATVCGFTFDGDRIAAVEVCDGQGRRVRVRGQRFVLAAGTVENVRLLLHGATVADCPWRHNRMVGRRFQDHLGGRIADIKPHAMRDFSRAFATLVVKGDKLQPKIRTTNDFVGQPGNLNIQAMLAFESSISENLVFLKQFVKAALYGRRVGSLKALLKNSIACSRYLLPLMWNYAVQHRLLIPGSAKISLHVQSETVPLDESRITIDTTCRDVYGLPKVILDWRVGQIELPQIKQFAERVAVALAPIADVVIVPELAAGRTEFLDGLYETGHQAGGCVMGESPETGVVDRDLRVFGTRNLYVLGASVFRSSGNANTTFSAMALAMRLKRHLVGI